MGILDKLLGRDEEAQSARRPAVAPSADEQAIARYRYMLQTAPPHTIEQAHAEAFAKLTPEQRTLLLQQLSAEMPDAERSAAAGSLKDDPLYDEWVEAMADYRRRVDEDEGIR